MTREDAISIMNVIVHMLEPKYDTDRVEDAVDMAIKSLEQEPKFEIVCRALVEITNKECSDYGYTEACDIADKYLEQIRGIRNEI